MNQAIEKTKYNYQEYLQLERDTDIRHEFWNGEVFAMAGGTRNHNRIGANVNNFLSNHFNPKGCETFFNDVKLELQVGNYYVYPDVLLTCDKDDNDAYLVKRPSLIVEVLSKSTEAYDRSTKLAHYRKIKSLRYYLLVSQTKPMVEVYGRQSETSIFTYEVYESINEVVKLPALDFVLPMTEIYKYITFTEE
ncbi:MAG: Uma2 family endonuclease [Flavobacterium sp.]|nr:Uma2 family endonuclease [Flavobacterium sp.]